MLVFSDVLIEAFNNLDVFEKILSAIASIVTIVGVPFGLIKGGMAIYNWFSKRKTNFRYVKRKNLKPTDIMHDRGEESNGFDANAYFPREEVDNEIERFVNDSTSNLLVITGLLSSGKSRAVYEVLRKNKNVKKIALCYEKDLPYNWKLEQWEQAVAHLKKSDILYIDSITDITFDGANDIDTTIDNWKKIFSYIHSHNLRCIVTLATSPQDEDESFARLFLDICTYTPDAFRGQAKASVKIPIVIIPEITKGDDFYKHCKSFLPGDYYSPVVGDYVNYRYSDSVWASFNKFAVDNQGQIVRMFVAIVLTLKYSSYSKNVIPCNYLEKLYARLAKDAGNSEAEIKEGYENSITQLESLKLIKVPKSKAVCIIQGEHSFEHIKEKLFGELDSYHARKLKNLQAEPKGMVQWIEPYIRRNDNLYIEKKQTELLLSIDPNALGLYKDAIVCSSPQNTLIIAEKVRKILNSHFFELDNDEKPSALKMEYKSQMEDLCDLVGVLVSRTCHTYSGAKKLLEEYLQAGVEINEDIICELLRIAEEEDTTIKDREALKSYAFKLAEKQFGDGEIRGVDKLLMESRRFNTSYESVCENYDALRIARGFGLQASYLKQIFDIVKPAFDNHSENQIEEHSGKTYQKLWKEATSSLFHYCRKVTERLRSTYDLKLLMAILCTEEIQKQCKEIEDEIRKINRHDAYYTFTFMYAPYMSNVAHAVLAYNPLGYIGDCKDMAALLFQSKKDPKYRYVFNSKSIFYFVGMRNYGVMSVIPDFNNAFEFYVQLRNILSEIDSKDADLEKALVLWLYPLFSKIKGVDHFKCAKEFVLSPEDILSKQKEKAESIISNRKLINALMDNAPSYEVAYNLYAEYKAILAEQIDTISILLGHIKTAVGKKHITEEQKKKYAKLTIEWMDVIKTLEWNKCTTDAARVNSILVSIKERIKNDKNLSDKISDLKLSDDNTQKESQLTKDLIAMKNGGIDCRLLLRDIYNYYSVAGEDMYEVSDYITHLIKYAYGDTEGENSQKQQLSVEDITNIRAMLSGDEEHLPIDELFSPNEDFYKQALYKVFTKEEYDFTFRWEYIKYAYIRMLTCNTLPANRDKQGDLLYKLLRPTFNERPDAIEKMQKEIYYFVEEHPVFITMFMSTICKLADFYTNTLINMEDPQKRQKIVIELRNDLDRLRPIPKTEEEIQEGVKKLVKNKLDRINKLLMTLKFQGKPLPFDDRFAISISMINSKLTDYVGPWYIKGPFTSFDDFTRHAAWDNYVDGKTNVNYEDLLPKIINVEMERICVRMLETEGIWENLKIGAREDFKYLSKELMLLKENCTAEQYREDFDYNIRGVYANFKKRNVNKTAEWPDEVFTQFSIFSGDDQDALNQWKSLMPNL